MDKKLIGVDLGGTTIKFAILTQDGEVQQKWSIKTNILDEGSHIVPDIIESINHHLDLYEMKPEQFIGIGMGTPGTVDVEKGTVIGAYNLNWKTLQNVKEEVEKGTGIAFALDNDANVAALGEQWKGAGENAADVAFITLGTGVGGGIIADGKLLHGMGAAGEVGHVNVEPGGYLCTCGNRGCLETYASATGVVRVARDMAEEFAGKSALKDAVDNGDDVTSKMVLIWLKKTMSWLSKSLIAFVATLGLHAQISAAFCIRNISSSVVVYLLPETSYWNKSPNISSNMLFQRFATRQRSNWHVLATMPA